ncbi:MAG: hypothetical protein AAB037_02465 [Chloroflexota bacterium]
MIKAIAKLYRDQRNAEMAVDELRKQGFDGQEVGLLFKKGSQGLKVPTKHKTLSLPQIGECTAWGPLSQINPEEPAKSLAQLLDMDEDTVVYYSFGLALGAVLVTIHAEEPRVAHAIRILKAAEGLVVGETASPAFALASYMTNTNPVDAKMTGDFRRY